MRLSLCCWILIVLWATGCGETKLNIGHSLPPTPLDQKPTPEALHAKQFLDTLLAGETGVKFTKPLFMPDQSWRLGVQFSSQDAVLPVMQKIRAATKHSSFIGVEGKYVGLWLDQELKPVGNIIRSDVSLKECQTVAQTLNQEHPKAAVTTVISRGIKNLANFTLPCYVQALFPDNASFDAYLNWKNPHSHLGDVFHMDFFREGTTDLDTVWILAQRILETTEK